MNPKGPNENFQDYQMRVFAEAIYAATEKRLVDAVVKTLGLENDKDENGDPIVMTFDYAYEKMVEAGYALNHKIVEKGGSATLQITVYKECAVYESDFKTTFSAVSSDLLHVGIQETVSE